MLARRVTRVIFNTTEITQSTQDPTAAPTDLVMTGADFLYVGFQGRFAARHFNFNSLNTNASVLTIEYWDGSDWQAVKDLIDETVGFTKNGFISWINSSDWNKLAQTPIVDVELFYVRISVSADLSAGTSIQSLLNLFCDDRLLRRFYPEIISDSRYLPPGRSDFIEQYIAGKDRVVIRLKQRKVIHDESQIIDINAVAEAAVHAVAKIILSPIDQDDELIKRADADFKNEINDLSKNADTSGDGKVSENEKRDPISGTVVRR